MRLPVTCGWHRWPFVYRMSCFEVSPWRPDRSKLVCLRSLVTCVFCLWRTTYERALVTGTWHLWPFIYHMPCVCDKPGRLPVTCARHRWTFLDHISRYIIYIKFGLWHTTYARAPVTCAWHRWSFIYYLSYLKVTKMVAMKVTHGAPVTSVTLHISYVTFVSNKIEARKVTGDMRVTPVISHRSHVMFLGKQVEARNIIYHM